MANLILIKHSLPEISPQIPAAEWHLSYDGRQRCQILAEKLLPYSPDIIYSSPEPKAFETASIVSKNLTLEIIIAHDLHEHKRHSVKFLDRNFFEKGVADLFLHPNDLVFGEETAGQALQRFSTCLHSLTTQNSTETMAVITHGTVITLYLEKHCGLEPFPLWVNLGLPSFIVLSTPDFSIISIDTQVS